MKTYLKLLFRTIKSNALRFVLLMLIVATGVGLSTGIGTFPDQLSTSFEEFYAEKQYPSFIIKGTEETANLYDTLDELKNSSLVKDANGLIEYDQLNGTRTYFINFEEQTLNKLELVKGKFPETPNEILVETETDKIKKYNLGDEITYSNEALGIFDLKLEVVGIVQNPLLIFKGKIPTNIDQDINLERVIYFDQGLFSTPIITDIHVLLDIPENMDLFSGKYRDFVDEQILLIEEELKDESLVFIPPNDTVGYHIVQSNIDKMLAISFIFPVFFTFVIMIVVIASIGRLIEEDRAQVGTLLSLGISKAKINFRYYLLGIIASIFGSVLGIVIGYNTLARLIYISFGSMMFMPERTSQIHIAFGVYVSLFILVVMILSILIATYKQMKEKPAALLRHKAPKPGTKIFLERITPLWKRISFTYKSSLRNIFRYPLNFLMNVLALMGSTALIFAGIGLHDNTVGANDGYGAFVATIAILIILFAAALSILVTYNLTNMNIEERKREIATLKVLGYHKGEVRSYIFREMFIVSFIGILLGLPLGYLIVDIVFELIDFGSADQINWYSWPMVVGIALVFIGISNLLLIRKIDKIDMNDSLKTLD